MFPQLKKYRESLSQFIKFGLVGLLNTIISYVSYTILVFLGINYLISNTIAFIISVLNSYYWNNRYVFRQPGEEKRVKIKALIKVFVSYGFTGLVLNSFLLMVWINIFDISKYIAPAINLIITIPINFLLNKLWAFKIEK